MMTVVAKPMQLSRDSCMSCQHLGKPVIMVQATSSASMSVSMLLVARVESLLFVVNIGLVARSCGPAIRHTPIHP